MSKSKRQEWEEAMNLVGATKPKKEVATTRRTGRQSTMSKAQRVVDEETRKEVHDARLDALEADNYDEDAGEAPDEEYVDSEEEERQARRSTRKKKGASKAVIGASDVISRFKIKSLAQWVMEAGYDETGASGPNYLSVAMRKSNRPPRHFCSVCGHWGTYSCTRCGMRYCSSKCFETHKETRCLKFAV